MKYEFDGKKYRQASAHQKEWGARLIGELNIRGTERILDLGCGDGTLTAQLAELVPHGHVTGIDASAGMIEAARSHLAANLSFALKDINSLDYSDEFDIVFSNATLHWIKDHDTMLANVHRSLRVGGFARFNFAGDGNCLNFFQVLHEGMEHPDFERRFHDFEWPWFMPSVEEYGALVRRSSFADARVWGENADRYFPDEEAMIGWIDQPSLVPVLPHISEPHRQSFRSFVIERMIRLTRQDDGRCFETFRRINLSARKHCVN
jgi:trans-aconitate 2-methyltransferase